MMGSTLSDAELLSLCTLDKSNAPPKDWLNNKPLGFAPSIEIAISAGLAGKGNAAWITFGVVLGAMSTLKAFTRYANVSLLTLATLRNSHALKSTTKEPGGISVMNFV